MRPVLPDDPARLRAWRDATLYRLVTRASEAEMRETLSRLRQRGYQNVTNADTALLANLDTADTTISVLARRCGVTRQAASQQLALLSQKGYVSRKPDPADSRAILVTLGGDLPVATPPRARMRSSAGPAGTSAAACSRPAGRRRPG
jgi:DNA-binding transcriptional ArsR family regulator